LSVGYDINTTWRCIRQINAEGSNSEANISWLSAFIRKRLNTLIGG
jgi:hypothetical protein